MTDNIKYKSVYDYVDGGPQSEFRYSTIDDDVDSGTNWVTVDGERVRLVASYDTEEGYVITYDFSGLEGNPPGLPVVKWSFSKQRIESRRINGVVRAHFTAELQPPRFPEVFVITVEDQLFISVFPREGRVVLAEWTEKGNTAAGKLSMHRKTDGKELRVRTFSGNVGASDATPPKKEIDMALRTEEALFESHEQEIQDILLPPGEMKSYVIQPRLLRKDDKLGAVGLLTQAQLRTAMLDDSSSWMLGTMLRGLVVHTRRAHLVDPEIEKLVVPPWAAQLLAALDIPTIYGKPIVARTDELDIWELHWTGSGIREA